jgi:hypothetical protein
MTLRKITEKASFFYSLGYTFRNLDLDSALPFQAILGLTKYTAFPPFTMSFSFSTPSAL